MIYDDAAKKVNVALFSSPNGVIEIARNVLIKEGYSILEYEDLKEIEYNIEKEDIRIVMFTEYNLDYIQNIRKKSSIVYILIVTDDIRDINIKEVDEYDINVTSYNNLNIELLHINKTITKSYKEEFERFKRELIGNLVDSIAHEIQANLLLIGASLDVIKMISIDPDIAQNNEKIDIMNSLYSKNTKALEKANMLVRAISDATDFSSQSIMQYEDIVDIIELILNRDTKEKEVRLLTKANIRKGTYICGSINDAIIITCEIIKNIMIGNNKQKIIFEITEDESNWYFNITSNRKFELTKKEIEDLEKYTLWIRDIYMFFSLDKISIIIKKVK